MSSRAKDWTGQRFGRLTAIRNTFVKGPTGNYLWEYICDCGNIVIAKSGNVVYGHTKSCGCLVLQTITKHGMSGSGDRTFGSWKKMMCRAHYNYEEYRDYYEGVTVCDRWSDENKGFLNFLEDMGTRPSGMTLNRKHGKKEYNKENCEWASLSMQSFDVKRKSSNKSGRTGVKWRDDRGVWEANITVQCKVIRLYYGPSFEEACAAREEAELKYYGFTKE